MAKTLSTALVCSIALLVQSYAQEVFSGDQKAKPKYPKAQPAAVERAETSAVKADKTESVAKSRTVASSTSKTAVAAKAPAKKVTGANDAKTAPASASKDAAAPNTKHESVASTEKKGTVAATESPKHAASIPTQAKSAAVALAKPKLPTAPLPIRAKSETGVAQAPKSAVPVVHSSTAPKIRSAGGSAVVTVPAEGPKQKVVANVSRKPPVTQTKVATLSPIVTTPEEDDAEDSPVRKTTVTKSSSSTLPVTKKAGVTVKPVAVLASNYVRKEAYAPAKSSTSAETMPGATIAPPLSGHFDTAFTKLADGFDFPVGRPDAQGYYKARGFRSGGHLGEDWDGVRGGDTDLGDPIYSIGDGLVVFARDCHMGWGNVLIVRHSYREGGSVKTVDALYGHLNSMLVQRGQAITRGQKIATMGNAHGLYDAHLHLEIRKNLEIGMSRAAFARDFSNYYDPTQFIQGHRHLATGGGTYRVAMNTFSRDANIKWDKARNFSHAHSGGGSSESAAALKRALASKP